MLISPLLKALQPVPQAPVLGLAHFGHLLALLMAGLMAAFAWGGEAKPLQDWRWMDVAGEGGMVLMAAIWITQLRSSRPGGRVTSWLCLGLAGILLGEWVDVLDEFWRLPKAVLWDNWLESSLTPLGMLVLTIGLQHWREEERALSDQLLKRERLIREHRSFDAITQLGDADYLARQIALEQQREGQPGAALLMLSLDGFDSIAREHGLAEADRLLQAAGHLLILNLRPEDLLCRYAADRFALLMPGAGPALAAQTAGHLQQALGSLAHHSRQGQRIQRPARVVWSAVDADEPGAQQLLRLAARL